jgi:acetyl-CoA acetyltransferase
VSSRPDLGIAASRQALVRAGIDPVDIDLVVCATSTPDRTFPATGVRIQAGLGITKGAAFDVQAVCSGFVYALSIADNFLKTGQFKRAVVVGAETFSRILDWEDRGTCVPVRRWRGCGGARGADAARQPRRPRHPRHPHPLRWALRGSALRRWRAGLDQDHRAICA